MKQILIAILITITATSGYAQKCIESFIKTKPDTQYIISGENNDLVIDSKTNLMWMRCSIGLTWDGVGCSGDSSKYSWQQALNLASEYVFSGYDDWRLPNFKELVSLIEISCFNNAINEFIFPNIEEYDYFSSTPSKLDVTKVRTVNFDLGSGNISRAKEDNLAVRLVRNY